jgi:hypothetical protein
MQTRWQNTWRTGLLVVAAALHGLMSGGCVAGGGGSTFAPERVVRAAVDVPERFLVGGWNDGSVRLEPPSNESGCRSPLVDPRDGAQLRLVRSGERQGDYEAPSRRYGLKPGKLLRVDCATGRAIGVVRR